MIDPAKISHRVWAEIDLDNLVFNFKQAQKAAPNSETLAVIKADAYGHGAVPAAKALAAAGAKRFAVATAEEALQLRRHGVREPILLLGMVPTRWAPQLAGQDITLAVGTLEYAETCAELAAGAGVPLKVHVKVDTGMRRIGFEPAEAVASALAVAALPGVEVEGIFTHFCVADDPAEDDFTALQFERFMKVCDGVKAAGLNIPLRHCANSAGIIAHPETHLDMVRPGIMLYGSNPCRHIDFELRAPLSLRGRMAYVKPIGEGESVGYGRTWYAGRPSVIASIGIGYADGLLRNLSNKIEMLARGQRAKQVGRICMDMTMLDVTDVPGVQTGDVATLIGTDGAETITGDEMADAIGTISYEVFCAVGRRVPRLYLQNGEVTGETCYVDLL
ncbi:alanine racemase [Ruminococcaceae bacterium OttesenSCG-928-D13]|nr:alanine racemase [Ruminococcaceae bacterium OttesenSCG-928-D13]